PGAARRESADQVLQQSARLCDLRDHAKVADRAVPGCGESIRARIAGIDSSDVYCRRRAARSSQNNRLSDRQVFTPGVAYCRRYPEPKMVEISTGFVRSGASFFRSFIT